MSTHTPIALALALAACASSPPILPSVGPSVAQLRINEVLPSNSAGLTDEQGEHPDWVELVNLEDRVVSLEGYALSDGNDAVELAAVEIPAGGLLVLFADADEGDLHVDLRLDVEGESLTLLAPDGSELDSLTWGPLLPDHSLARVPDGGPDWQVQPEPTPAEPNPGEPLGTEPATPCTLEIDDTGRYSTEGAVLHLAADCAESGSWRFDWFGPAVFEGASLDLSTGPGAAGTYEILVSGKQRDAAGVPSTRLVEVSVADGWADPANQPVDPATYTREWGLPVLHLDADPSTVPQDYVPTGAWLDGVQYTAQIKIRGAASAGYPKNNYTVEFDPVQLDLGPYGLSNKDHLVLVGNFDDNSHVRQRLVYDTWAEMAAFWGEPRLTPRSTPMVVYMNGAYHGLYLALDHVDDEFLREMDFLSGGDLYKSVSHDANFYLHNAGGGPKATLHDGWEKKEGLNPYDFGPIEALTGWVGGTAPAEVAAGLEGELPVDEFMDWFHLAQAFAADDSAGKNAYLYLDPVEDRWRYVPWDFNHALGQTWQTARQDPYGVNDYVWNNAIFQIFQTDPVLAPTLWSRAAAMRAPGGPLALDPLLARLEQYDAELVGHPDRDWERWGAEYQVYGLWYWRTDWTTPAQERAYVEQWIRERTAVLAP